MDDLSFIDEIAHPEINEPDLEEDYEDDKEQDAHEHDDNDVDNSHVIIKTTSVPVYPNCRNFQVTSRQIRMTYTCSFFSMNARLPGESYSKLGKEK